jgi:hypothetical protein
MFVALNLSQMSVRLSVRIDLCLTSAQPNPHEKRTLLFDVISCLKVNMWSVETLINEETLLLAKYLRGENDTWIPRVPSYPFPTVLEWEVATQE